MTDGKNARLPEIDVLRFFAIVGVICIHAFGIIPSALVNVVAIVEENRILMGVNQYVESFSDFAVPLFIIVSGFVLAYHYSSQYNLREFYSRRLTKIVPPYIFISLLSILGLALIEGIPSLTGILFKLATASASSPLWFVAIILQLYLLYPVFSRLFRIFGSMNCEYILVCATLALQLFWELLARYIDNQYHDPTTILVTDRICLGFVFYFALGICLARNYPAFRAAAARVNPLVPGTVAILLSVYTILPFTLPYITELLIELLFVLVTIFFLFQISLDISQYSGRVSRLIRSMGYCSFGMYLIHPFILYLAIIGLFMAGLNNGSWAFCPVLLGIVLSGSYLVVYMMAKFPFTEFLIGVRPENREETLGPGKKLPRT